MSDLEVFQIRPRQVTRWNRFTDAIKRSITLGPWNPRDPAIARFFNGGPVHSGVPVNEQTALNYSAVWAAVNLISEDIAKVPLMLYKRQPDGGKARFDNHGLYRIVHDSPNPQMSSLVFRRTLQAHKLVWGNGYAEIERDGAGRPVNLWPLMPYAVEPRLVSGQLVYRVFQPTGGYIDIAASDMIHLRGYSQDGICGMSVIAAAKESLGLGIAAERFGATFFGNGSSFGGIISYPPGIGGNPQVRKENREALEREHQGPSRAHRFLALYEGAKYERLGIPPNDAQFIETRELQIEEVCRWFNVPPHKLRHLKRATNNNIEQQSIEYVTDTLDPHWEQWEQELTAKLIAPLEQRIQFIEHVREGLLRGDAAARGDFYSKMVTMGAMTINEVRQRENLNPVPGGDTVFVQLNTWPLNRLNDRINAELEATTPPVLPTDSGEKKALEDALEATRHLAQEWEDKHDILQAQIAAEVATRHALEQEVGRLSAAPGHLGELLAASLERESAIRASLDTAAEQLGAAIQTVADAERRLLAAEAVAQEAVEARALAESAREAALAHAAATVAAADEKMALASETARASIEAAARERDTAEEAERLATEALTLERDARRREQDAHAAVYADLEAQKAAGDAERLAVMAQVASVEHERDEARGAVQRLESALAIEQSARSAEQAAYGEAVARLEAAKEKAETERDAAVVASVRADTAKDAAVAEALAFQEAAAQAQQERDDALDQAATASREASSAIGERDVLTVEADELRTELARARADLATEAAGRKAAEARLNGLVPAQRHVFAEAFGRLVRREAAKAKNYQTTPQRLAAWMSSFYDKSEEDLFVEALLPAVRVHLEWLGSSEEPAEYARARVREHFAESQRALTKIIESGPDGFGDLLQRTLHRWESTRADDMADRLVGEELRHGR